MIKRVILVGQGASGKDYLKIRLQNKGLTPSVSYTTRPPRIGEENGVSYHFIDDEIFTSMIARDEFREWNLFSEKKWYYGTSKKVFETAQLFVMTPSGIKALSQKERDDSLVLFIDIPEEIRRERLIARKDADDVERRLHTDRIDFKDFMNYDFSICVPDFDSDEIYRALIEQQILIPTR